MSLWTIPSCTTVISEVGECPERSEQGNDQFERLRKLYPEHASDDLRIAEFCRGLKPLPWWNFWERW